MIGIIAAAMTALISVMVWYLKYQTKLQAERDKKHDEQQAKREEKHDKIQEEDRKFHRNLITNHLTGLQKIGAENSKLNSQSMVLLKDIDNSQNKLCKLIESVDRKINGRK